MKDEKATTETTVSEISVKEQIAKDAADASWKKEPWINKKDGFEYRKQRVKNKDGTFTVFNARIGKKPRIEPEE